jgi:Mrp family chromosome partitioning ATPase
MGAFLEQLGTTHDIVIVDAPPILPVADTLALAAAAAATILVIRQGNTRQGAVGQALEQLDQVGTHLVGVVVTHAARAKARHGYYEAPAPRAVTHQPLLRRALVEAVAERDMAGVSYWPRP